MEAEYDTHVISMKEKRHADSHLVKASGTDFLKRKYDETLDAIQNLFDVDQEKIVLKYVSYDEVASLKKFKSVF